MMLLVLFLKRAGLGKWVRQGDTGDKTVMLVWLMQTLPTTLSILDGLVFNLDISSHYLQAQNVLKVSVSELASTLFICCGFVFRLKLPISTIPISM